MPRYLYWRKSSLWCCLPVPGYPPRYPLGIRSTGTKADRARCERQGEAWISERRHEELFGIPKPKSSTYNPTFWRLVGRYWWNHLRFQPSGANERYHLAHSLKRFGSKFALDMTRDDVENWRQEMKKLKTGNSINAINNRFSYLRATFKWAHGESSADKRLMHDPTLGMHKLGGARVRAFVLTAEKFERNLSFLREGDAKKNVKPSARFAQYYLALWETGRRPLEVSQYTWEMISDRDVDGQLLHIVSVPPEISKTDQFDLVIISPRLWAELQKLPYRSGYLFLNDTAGRWLQWRRHMAKLQKRFGQAEAGWCRDTRRGFITHKTEVQKKDPMHVKKQSGHKTNSVFERYRVNQLSNQAGLFDDFSHSVHTEEKKP